MQLRSCCRCRWDLHSPVCPSPYRSLLAAQPGAKSQLLSLHLAPFTLGRLLKAFEILIPRVCR